MRDRVDPWLELKVADFRCAVPVERVREVVRSAALEEAARAPAGVCGTTLSQGRRVPVVDLGQRFHLAQEKPTQGRILVTRSADRWVGLKVDAVSGVVPVPQAAIQRLPREVLTPQSQYFAGAFLDRPDGDEWLILLDVDRLLAGSSERIGR